MAPLEGPPGPHTVIDDVATPFDGEPCNCHDLGSDGIDDLSMKFSRSALIEGLELADLDGGTMVELVVSGNLVDGTAFTASDCIKIVPPGDMDADNDVDGDDFLTFSLCYSGPGDPPSPGCRSPLADIDGDGDVDGEDFLTFSLCFNGSLNPPNCP